MPREDFEKARHRVEIVVEENHRSIRANGIPNHSHGSFPNRGNPNSIREQNYEFRVTIHPEVEEKVTPLNHMLFGVALNGVVFDPGTAEWWKNDFNSGWNYEALSGKINLGIDSSHAHVQPNGAYHYHGLPEGLISQSGREEQMILVGYAADGFPIYNQYGYTDSKNANSPIKKMNPSYQLKKGPRPTGPEGIYDGTFVQDYEYLSQLGDLDECNGRLGVTPEYPEGIYHYYITETFPFIPRYFRGIPDESFQHKGSRGQGREPPPHGKGKGKMP